MHLRDGDAVVRDGDGLLGGAAQARLHFALVQHARAAVNDERVRGEVIRELTARGEGKIDVPAGVAFHPARQLFRADVTALAVMCAALGDENRIAVFQTPQRRRAQNRRAQVALVARKQDGKRGQTDAFGYGFADDAERL